MISSGVRIESGRVSEACSCDLSHCKGENDYEAAEDSVPNDIHARGLDDPADDRSHRVRALHLHLAVEHCCLHLYPAGCCDVHHRLQWEHPRTPDPGGAYQPDGTTGGRRQVTGLDGQCADESDCDHVLSKYGQRPLMVAVFLHTQNYCLIKCTSCNVRDEIADRN